MNEGITCCYSGTKPAWPRYTLRSYSKGINIWLLFPLCKSRSHLRKRFFNARQFFNARMFRNTEYWLPNSTNNQSCTKKCSFEIKRIIFSCGYHCVEISYFPNLSIAHWKTSINKLQNMQILFKFTILCENRPPFPHRFLLLGMTST